jgi:transcriptional regulator with XRE-family HTH domain
LNAQNVNMHTGEWIRKLIADAGLTVDQACDALGLSRPGFYKIVNDGQVREKHVQKLAALLNMTPAEVRYGFQRRPAISERLANNVLVGIEEYLTGRGLALAPEKKAQLFCRLYAHFQNSDTPPPVSAISDLLAISDDLATR